MTFPQTKGGFFIGVSCPGCGGELELEENFFVLTCSHCGSVLRIIPPETPPAFLARCKILKREVRFHVDRFLKKKDFPLTGSGLQIKALYYPYWKVDAVVLKVRNKVIERLSVSDDDSYSDDITAGQKRIEISFSPYSITLPAGCEFEGIPHSLGFRTGYLKVVPFARENVPSDADPLPVLVTWPEALEKVKMTVRNLSRIDLADFAVNKTELFQPVGSLIYFPYYLLESYDGGQFLRLVVDGVTGRVCSHTTEISASEGFSSVEPFRIEFGQLMIEFHRCSNCGMDLPPKQSFIYICDNCHVLTMLEKHTVAVTEIGIAVTDSSQTDKLFPFWSFKLVGRDADKIQRFMGGIYGSDRLVVPGFKVSNFEAAYRLTKRMSAAFPKMDISPLEKLDSRFELVTLGPSQAETLGRAIIYREELIRNPACAPEDIEFQIQEVSLFYAPFHPERYFYVDSIVGAITFEKSLVD